MRILLTALVLLLFSATSSPAQTLSSEQQVDAATSAAPSSMREGATVLGYTSDGAMTTLREGQGDLVCLADEPGDDRFHVACYHTSLEPFMRRGRTLRADDMDGDEVDRIRRQEIEEGTLSMPEQAAALYSLTGPADSFDRETGVIDGARPLYVLYLPYATNASTGLPPRAPAGQPWLMDSGSPWAHVMVVPPQD